MAKDHNHCVTQLQTLVAVMQIHLWGNLFAFANLNNCLGICFLAIRQLLLKINSGKLWFCLVWKLSACLLVQLSAALPCINEATFFMTLYHLSLASFPPQLASPWPHLFAFILCPIHRLGLWIVSNFPCQELICGLWNVQLWSLAWEKYVG